MGSTTLLEGRRLAQTFQAFGMPVLQAEPEVDGDKVRFVQTAGGRPGMPSPRRVNHPPFVQWKGPLVWSTLALTIQADGRAEFEMLDRQPLPPPLGLRARRRARPEVGHHRLQATGTTTPSASTARGATRTARRSSRRPRRRSSASCRPRSCAAARSPRSARSRPGRRSSTEGEAGTDLFLLLDGVVRVDVDGEPVAEMGPGAVFGERALLEGGTRTATLVAVTQCRVAVARADQLDVDALAGGRRRPPPGGQRRSS